MQMQLFAVGEGVNDRILAGNSVSLNANLAKCREGAKKPELGTERKKPIPEASKAGLLDGGFAMDKVKQSENASHTE